MLLAYWKPCLFAMLVIATMAYALDNQKWGFMERAVLELSGDTIIVKANSPRPLDQAVEALREQYDWIVDFEDPPYESPYDVVDATDPKWRKEHPFGKSVTRINGGAFEAQIVLPHQSDLTSPSAIVLNQLVSDYAQSGNPGQFVVRRVDNRRFDVVGVGVKDNDGNPKTIAPIFDTRITLPEEQRSLLETLRLILGAIQLKTGVRVDLGYAPMSLLIHAETKTGGKNVDARKLLAQALDSSGSPLLWRLFYSTNSHMYFMNVEVASQMNQDNAGHIIFHSIRKSSS